MSRPTRGQLAAALLGLLVVAGLVLVLTVGLPGRGTDAAAAPTDDPVRTTTVTRGDLTQSSTVPGSLGFGPVTPLDGHAQGTVTWLPAVGTVVDRGAQLYRVDDQPVVLLLGDLPLYRPLAAEPEPDGSLPHGADVDLLVANLAALGLYDGPTTDARYDWTVRLAVQHWQTGLGRTPSGALDPTDVVVSATPLRVASVTARLGDAADGPLLEVTGAEKVVTLDAPVALAPALAAGQEVPVTLGDGTTVTAAVGTVGPQPDDPGSGAPPSVPVTLTTTEPLDAPPGPVTARIVTAAHPGVLSVPVAALVALAGGGYAVEVPERGLVPVTIGMVADGDVEVEGVDEGTAVVVP